MVRVFVNYVDNYTGEAISKVLSLCRMIIQPSVCWSFQVLASAKVGSTALGDDSDDVPQEGSSEHSSNQPSKPGEATNYVVIGTKSGPEVAKPDWVSEIIDVSIENR